MTDEGVKSSSLQPLASMRCIISSKALPGVTSVAAGSARPRIDIPASGRSQVEAPDVRGRTDPSARRA